MQTERFTNNTGIPLSVAVWLVDDEYDYVDDPNYISVTELIKSPRQIILGRRVQDLEPQAEDIVNRMAIARGNAVHNGIENAWLLRYKTNMMRLGYPQKVIDRIRINPTPEELIPGVIPVYMEQRAFQQAGKYTIGGKFDFVGDGIVDDFKTTGVYSYMSGSNDWKYMMQGSLYRWLNPDMITGDHINIQFDFSDWKTSDARAQAAKGYPPTRMFQHKLKLLSLPETDAWVQQRVALLESLEDVPEPELPLCDKEYLWQDPPKFKYYKNPEAAQSGKRSTKNYDTMAEAQLRLVEDGHVGAVVEVPGMVKACNYCSCAGMCSQRDRLAASGQLQI